MIEKRKKKKKENWYQSKINPNVYIQGLPPSISKSKIIDFFSRAGVLRIDITTGEERIKVYTDKFTGEPKGDAMISYENQESVSIAIDMLNGREIVPGFPLKIEQATFEQKGEYKPREAVKIDELTKIKYKSTKEKIFGWQDTEELIEGPKIIIVKNMFGEEDYDENHHDEFFQELELDIKEEFISSFGSIKRLEIYDLHKEGIVKIKFEKSIYAEKCVKEIDGRMYNGRKLICDYWDGKTNYKIIRESNEEESKRIDEFGKWIYGQISSELSSSVNK